MRAKRPGGDERWGGDRGAGPVTGGWQSESGNDALARGPPSGSL